MRAPPGASESAAVPAALPQEFLQKLSGKLGDVDMGDVMKSAPPSAAGPTAANATAAVPDIENLLQAAK